jgi:integrase
MHDLLASAPWQNDELSGFLDALRGAARSKGRLVLAPEQVRILVYEEVYTLLASMEVCWRNACADAGVAGATPKTLRHTMLTWLAERGVPYEQRQMLAGHSARGTTARHYEHLSPTYLKCAIEAVDAYFSELEKLTSAIKGPATCT